MDTYRYSLSSQVARDLHAARVASPWSLTSLAAVVGISRGHLIRIQNGRGSWWPSTDPNLRLGGTLQHTGRYGYELEIRGSPE